MKKIFYLIIFILCQVIIYAQPNGYEHKNDTTTFIFKCIDYNLQVKNKVVISGDFNNWNTNMNDSKYIMRRQMGNIFTLRIYNPNFEIIKPNTEFRFRIDEGKWLKPPTLATNAEDSNLIFMKGAEPLEVQATLMGDNEILVTLVGLQQQDNCTASDIILTNTSGQKIAIKNLVYLSNNNEINNDSTIKINHNHSLQFNLQTENGVDKRMIYYIEIPKFKLKSVVSFDGWFSKIKSDKILGANIINNGEQTSFSIFAPRATQVKLYLYKPINSKANYYSKTPYKIIELATDEQGIWETIINENLAGIWYDYTVHGIKEPSNFYFETNPIHISDPYAKVINAGQAASMVTQEIKAATPLKKGIPNLNEAIIYHVNIQDFTELLPIDKTLVGTFSGMGIGGLTNLNHQAIGFDYLTNLGINTVNLMGVQEMYQWPTDSWKRAFGRDKFMMEQGISTENYNWGNFVSHGFALATQFRKKDTKPGSERAQFRDLIQQFHDKKIAVIIDLNINQTAENINGKTNILHFTALDKQYYYRTKNLEQIGKIGNEIKSENRYMVQRWIIDQCNYFITEFGVDGFKINMAKLTDKETLLALKAALPTNILLIAEPWGTSNDANFNKNPSWNWNKKTAPICYLNDEASNAFKGTGNKLFDKKKHRGWAGENTEERNNVVTALSNLFDSTQNINSTIKYMDIYNNYALSDQFALTNFDGRFGVHEANYKIAATLLFTTPGPIFINGGSEFMRSKGLATPIPITKEISNEKLQFYGKQNTYNVRSPNQFVWENIGKPKLPQNTKLIEPYTNCNFKNMLSYWKGLINLRTQILQPLINSNSNFNNNLAANNQPLIENSFIQFITPENKAMLGYMIDNKILVLINNDNKPNSFETRLMNLKGRWKLIANGNEINLNGITQKTLIGNPIKPNGTCIWLKE